MSSSRANRDFVNWAGTVRTTPTAWREPATHDEVCAVVRDAARARQRVRVVGAGHSWSAIAAPDQVAVSLDRLSGVVAVSDDRTHVTVRAGTRLRDLNAELARRGLALPIVGSIAAQSVAGVIGTGTHGSSLVHGNLSSLVDAITLVDGRGDTVAIGADDPRIRGARVHLGALGAVTEVALRVCDAFRVAESVEALPLDHAIASLRSIARSAEYVKVWWFPHTTTAHVYRYERTHERTSTRPTPELQRAFDDHVMQAHVFRWVLAVEGVRPSWVPAFNRVIAGTFAHGRRVGRSDLMLNTPMPLVHRETEAAVALDKSEEAFDRIVSAIEREKIFVNMPLELRFVRGDDSWMSPAEGRDTCQIGAYAGRVPDVDRFYAAFWREMRALGARPHWGKELTHARDEIAALYPRFDDFMALRDALDPNRVFENAFQARALSSS
jgi:FAD/FMN-containing dehydrogenase